MGSGTALVDPVVDWARVWVRLTALERVGFGTQERAAATRTFDLPPRREATEASDDERARVMLIWRWNIEI